MRWCSFTLFAQIILCCRLGRFVLRKWWIKSERQKLLQFDFFFFPLAAIKTWEKSKPDDVFQKLHDSLFDCRFASVPIVLKNPLKNSLQSHTAASTNVIYIGLQLYCFICLCSSFGFLTNIIFILQSIIGLIGTLFQFLHRFSLLWLASVTRLRKTMRSGTKEDFIWRVNIQSIV